LATVLVFPADSGAWADYGAFPRRLRAIRADRNGHFETANLPAGDYLLVAIAEESSANWQDPQVLKRLTPVATPITLGDGDARSVSLKASMVPRR
jgi:hypothetical protein